MCGDGRMNLTLRTPENSQVEEMLGAEAPAALLRSPAPAARSAFPPPSTHATMLTTSGLRPPNSELSPELYLL